ncbi:hypothetical protein evm_012617 [Chilo suppressalis]|nr:hypothetical protein evm_012617 [Chilo suppressalis]
MTLPTPEGHDVTNASGISMKQYEEQLNALRKENFHLKLRIYFLEEKLGSGSPPAVQGSMSNDSVDLSINIAQTKIENTEIQESEKTNVVEDTCAESDIAGDYLGVTVNNTDLDELVKLRRENRKALQMIKGCMKKIQQQDKDIKKLKLNKELAYAHVSDSQMEKYEEILKCKDEHIKDLEKKIRELQKNIDNIQNVDASENLQQLLTRRLQGLAYFLDKLLSHKCVLGEDKKKLAESILEQSLALPVGLKLDESMAPGDLTMDESNLDISRSLRIEDLTLMFGHHVMCSDDNRRLSKKSINSKYFPQADILSESECWSEPDRNVSLARVGLCDTGLAARESTSEINKFRNRRSRVSYGSRSEDNKNVSETALFEEINQLSKANELLADENHDLNSKLDFAKTQIDDLLLEKDNLKSIIAVEHTNVEEANKTIDTLKNTILSVESRIRDLEGQLDEAAQTTEKLRLERHELEASHLAIERSLRRAADEATVQASQAALERARAQHDRLKVERELEETREKLSNALEANTQLQIEVTRRIATEADVKVALVNVGQPLEEDRPTSPDQGIDSDRLSSLEQNDAVALSPRSLYEENLTLKQKLARTKATLAETLAQLNAANMRKRSVQRAICREIHKTQGVLRKARDQLENQNE